jgi:hypothetical protein
LFMRFFSASLSPFLAFSRIGFGLTGGAGGEMNVSPLTTLDDELEVDVEVEYFLVGVVLDDVDLL